MRKWIIRIAVVLFSLLLLLFLGGYYLLGTQGGTDFLVAQTQKQLDGSLQIGSATGKILDRLELTDVTFENPAGRAELSHLVLDWKSTALLRRHLHILEFTADDISYTVLSKPPEPEPDPEKTGPLTLPDLKLPVTITVEQLAINKFVFVSAPEADPVTVDHAELALLWHENGIQLQELQVSMPQGSLQGQGEIKPTGDYPLQLATTLETREPDLPNLKLVGSCGGDLQKLVVEERLSGDISAELQVTLEQLLDDLAWQGDLEIHELVPAAFSPEVPGTLKGKIHTSGNLQQAAVKASLNMRDSDASEVNWDGELDLEADLKALLVNIKQVTLKHAELPARINMNGTASQQQLDLALDWQELQWPMNGEAEYNSAQGAVTLTGSVEDYHLSLDTDVAGSQIPPATVLINADGNTERADNIELVVNTLEGEVGVQGNVQWSPSVTWQLSTDGKDINPGAQYEEWPGRVQWLIRTRGRMENEGVVADVTLDQLEGNLRELDIAGSGEVHLKPENITINNLRLSSGSALLTARGELPTKFAPSSNADAAQKMDLTLDWQGLQWPLDGEADYGSETGAVNLTGTVDDYHLSLDADMAGSQIPSGTISLSADGNTKNAENLQLVVNTLEGEVGVQGKVQWAPSVTWQLKTDGRDINPGAQYEEWPGKLRWRIKTEGRMEEEGVIADVTLDQLEGNLRELPIAGGGEVHLKPENIIIDGFRLSSGSAVLTAQGELSSDSRLDWQAKVPDFADLLPQAGGSLSATGRVLGEMKKPRTTLTLAASSLAFQETSLERLQADGSLDLSWARPFSLKLSGANLQSGENLVRKLEMQARGSLEDHTAQLQASHDLVDLNLELQGGYLQEHEQWQGALEQLDISSSDFGNWKLAEQTNINAGPKAAELDRLCLERQATDICIKGSWDAENKNTGGNVEISGFPLDYLSPFYPEALTNLSGVFSLKASANMKEQLQADVVAAITPGSISYRTVKNEGSVPHEGVKLDLHAAESALDADIFLSIDSNTIKGKLSSPDLLKKDVGGKATIAGNLLIDAGKYDLVEALVPDIQELDLAVNTDFKIEGTLEQPAINGDGTFHIGHILIPEAGLELADSEFAITAGNKKLRINGVLNSPEGTLTLDGGAILDREQNWPARLTLKGENFRLINLPEIQIFLTPDLLLEKKEDLIRLTGNVTIPKADVLLRELPEGSETVSPDVVIIQEKKEEEDTSPVQMNLKVTLGDKVHFAGMGVNAFIDGQLSISAEPEEQMLGSGDFHIKEGSYRAYGQDLEILTGIISFPGGPLTQPGINLRAVRQIGEIMAGIYAIGPAAKPRITTFSNPPMSESNVISYLLTGSSPNDPSSGAKLSIGRQINNKLSVSVGTDVKTGEREFITRYRLNRKIHVQTTTATNSNAADVFYTVELGQKEDKEEER